MQPIDRRTALWLGGLGVIGAAVGGWGLSRQWTSSSLHPRTGRAFAEPEVLTSSNGVLDVVMEASAGRHRVAGRTVQTYGYSGGVPGPTLQVSPGDMLRIALTNRLEQPTNLHVHGLHVSPQGNGDNVFLSVAPGETFVYEHRLPDDHPPGTYWYHPTTAWSPTRSTAASMAQSSSRTPPGSRSPGLPRTRPGDLRHHPRRHRRHHPQSHGTDDGPRG